MAENNFTGVIESLMKGMNTVLSTKRWWVRRQK